MLVKVKNRVIALLRSRCCCLGINLFRQERLPFGVLFPLWIWARIFCVLVPARCALLPHFMEFRYGASCAFDILRRWWGDRHGANCFLHWKWNRLGQFLFDNVFLLRITENVLIVLAVAQGDLCRRHGLRRFLALGAANRRRVSLGCCQSWNGIRGFKGCLAQCLATGIFGRIANLDLEAGNRLAGIGVVHRFRGLVGVPRKVLPVVKAAIALRFVDFLVHLVGGISRNNLGFLLSAEGWRR
mmetsp:Transcript_13296/g.27529  ORF Transcript_13296/g.27529 Transcript_13296/m.27529 type:complete len:242 (+) Transcript_13296:953-1678(+)